MPSGEHLVCDPPIAEQSLFACTNHRGRPTKHLSQTYLFISRIFNTIYLIQLESSWELLNELSPHHLTGFVDNGGVNLQNAFVQIMSVDAACASQWLASAS